jgi:hypothetical protein
VERDEAIDEGDLSDGLVGVEVGGMDSAVSARRWERREGKRGLVDVEAVEVDGGGGLIMVGGADPFLTILSLSELEPDAATFPDIPKAMLVCSDAASLSARILSLDRKTFFARIIAVLDDSAFPSTLGSMGFAVGFVLGSGSTLSQAIESSAILVAGVRTGEIKATRLTGPGAVGGEPYVS